MKPIANPTLPPKKGYVEVEDKNGNRVYQKIPTEFDMHKKEQEQKELEYTQYLIDIDYRLSLIELGVKWVWPQILLILHILVAKELSRMYLWKRRYACKALHIFVK